MHGGADFTSLCDANCIELPLINMGADIKPIDTVASGAAADRWRRAGAKAQAVNSLKRAGGKVDATIMMDAAHLAAADKKEEEGGGADPLYGAATHGGYASREEL